MRCGHTQELVFLTMDPSSEAAHRRAGICCKVGIKLKVKMKTLHDLVTCVLAAPCFFLGDGLCSTYGVCSPSFSIQQERIRSSCTAIF